MEKIYTSADQLIGRTPLLELAHIEKEERLEARLGLSVYNVDAPLQPEDFWRKEQRIHKVKILLSQHIGAPAVPTVEKGAQVKCGQRIADPAQGLSVGIHASVDGRVQEVTERYIVIVCQ